MSISLLEIGQLISVMLAAGTPGMTYYVMMRLHKTQISHMEKNCNRCRAEIDSKMTSFETELDDMQGRQHELREKVLPDKFARLRDVDALKVVHEKDVEIIHKRIGKYHPA